MAFEVTNTVVGEPFSVEGDIAEVGAIADDTCRAGASLQTFLFL